MKLDRKTCAAFIFALSCLVIYVLVVIFKDDIVYFQTAKKFGNEVFLDNFVAVLPAGYAPSIKGDSKKNSFQIIYSKALGEESGIAIEKHPRATYDPKKNTQEISLIGSTYDKSCVWYKLSSSTIEKKDPQYLVVSYKAEINLYFYYLSGEPDFESVCTDFSSLEWRKQ